MGVRAGVKIWATLLVLAVGAPPALALDKITIGETGSGSATHWPTYVAMTKGFFKALDIEVEFVPAKGDWIDHRQFGLCRVDGDDEDGGLRIRLPSGIRKVIKLDVLEVLSPRLEGERKIFPLRPRRR